MLYKQTVATATLELLNSLMALPDLSIFALVGGTNLSLRYGHRISVDLDLFANTIFDSNELLPTLIRHYPSISVGAQKKTSIQCWIEGVKIDIVLHEYPYISPLENINSIRLVSVPDIIAMKLNAVTQRGAKKDFWDIAILLDEYSMEQMLGFYSDKYKMFDIFHVIRSLTFFDDAEKNIHETVQPLSSITWKQVKKKIESALKLYLKNTL